MPLVAIYRRAGTLLGVHGSNHKNKGKLTFAKYSYTMVIELTDAYRANGFKYMLSQHFCQAL